MKRSLLILFAVSMQWTGFSQGIDTLSIMDCLRIAEDISPLQRQKSLSGDALTYKIRNLNTNWFPSVGFNAQATYNSETIDFSKVITMPGISIPSLPLDQYKVWADINQQIYDGGLIKAQKDIEKASYEAGIQQVEANLRGIKQQVSQTFFSIILAKKSAAVLKVTYDELKEKKKIVSSGVENGVLLPENLLSIEAEEIRLLQNITELNFDGCNA
jgi:hypothetical protein